MLISCPCCHRQVEPIADRDRLICPSCNSPIAPHVGSTCGVDWKPEEETSSPSMSPASLPALETGPRRLGDFEVLREIGRGGMGVVYEARQTSLNRKVALKVLGPGLGLTPRAVVRFRREAEAAARLHHTNIVPIYATGEDGGTHYYAMELVEGPSLDRVIRGIRATRKDPGSPEMPGDAGSTSSWSGSGSSPTWVAQTIAYDPGSGHGSSSGGSSTPAPAGGYFDTVARLIAEVADALDYAHHQGVIHRDIKPSNLLLSPAGRLSINDFGLARILEEPGMTVSGEFVGSPMYMSPEQVTAGRAPLDHRTDIYSLGATLYECLTLEPPFPGERRDQVLAQILHKDPRPPRRMNRKIPLDLETICLKAMEKDPDRRYSSAGKMAEDLRRFLNRFAISARRAGPIRRAAKWVRRNRALASMIGCAVLLAVFVGVFALQVRVTEERLAAEKRQNAIDRALLIVTSGDLEGSESAIVEAEALGASPGWIRMVRGQLALHRGDTGKAIEHLKVAVEIFPRSVAAQSMLAEAYSRDGRLDEYEKIFLLLEKIPPLTPDDYLFKGMAESIMDPRRGLKTLGEAIHQRNSPIARRLRGDVCAHVALDTTDPEMARLALEDANAARAMMPENPVVLATDLWAHLVAAEVYRAVGTIDKCEQSLLQAGIAARELERFPRLSIACNIRWQFLEVTEQQEAAFELARKAHEEVEGERIVILYVLGLYRRGEFERARQTIERSGKTGEFSGRNVNPAGLLQSMKPYILAELPDGPSLALQAYKENRNRNRVGYLVLLDQTVLLLLGKRSEAMAACRELREGQDRLTGPQSEHYLRILDYCGGKVSEDALLKAEAGSRCNQCEAHYYVALDRLAQGDRAGAREHFQKALDTRVFTFWEFYWSRSFLRRMDQDPKWPPWIPGS